LVSQASAGGGASGTAAGSGGITRIGPIELKVDGERMKSWTLEVVGNDVITTRTKTYSA